jgi:hypothetical protein
VPAPTHVGIHRIHHRRLSEHADTTDDVDASYRLAAPKKLINELDNG